MGIILNHLTFRTIRSVVTLQYVRNAKGSMQRFEFIAPRINCMRVISSFQNETSEGLLFFKRAQIWSALSKNSLASPPEIFHRRHGKDKRLNNQAQVPIRMDEIRIKLKFHIMSQQLLYYCKLLNCIEA